MIDFGFLDNDEEVFPEYLGIGKTLDSGEFAFRVSFSFIDDETGKRRKSTLYITGMRSLDTKRELTKRLASIIKDYTSENYEYTIIRNTVKIEAGYRGE